MKKQHDIPQSLTDILTSIDSIEEYLAEFLGERRDFGEYMQKKHLRRSVERELAIIGEATNRIYKVNPEYPLMNNRQIIALRNRIVHAYDSLDNPAIWAIVVKHLPPLRAEVEKLLAQ